MNKAVIITSCILAISSVGCATSKKMQTVEIGDNKMTCGELRSELRRIDDAKENVEDKKGMTGTNVASFLFWLPGLAYTYYDASKANEAIEKRRSHINELYNQNGCAKK